ncbi:Bax inhibitor-1/YccA family protein [Geminicoccus roseus]|uniref:Bax inhibitor-1/YccA family protein n=1 Tax=Geminicoccus roseus TaxID=404900 RepID=UPI00041B5D22|nr:Bax inhibitor-1/YccA family protein [Geminicoccus roseus]
MGGRVAVDQVDAGLRRYMLSIYNYMGLGLALTGIIAMFVAATPAIYVPIFTSPLKWVVMLAPLGFIFFLGFRVQQMSASAVQMTFWAFCAVMGLSMASIFLVFTGESVARTFFITAAAFGALSLYGYTTKRDLSAMGTFLVVGLFGLIIASVVNIFIGSSAIQFMVSVAGVLIFAGLTAWDTQRLKEMYLDNMEPGAQTKMAVMGALTLYLDFINMFQFLLQFMGVRTNSE